VQFNSSAFGHEFKTGKAESGIYLSVEYIRGYGRYRERSRAGTSKEGVARCPMLKTLDTWSRLALSWTRISTKLLRISLRTR
jgi:hypothetical protein